MVIHWLHEAEPERALLGGKGASLVEMHAAGFPVPPGFCVCVDGYRSFTDAAELAPLVESIASQSDLLRLDLATEAVRPILDRIENTAIPPELSEQVQTAYATLGAEKSGDIQVAVRSSAVSEDGAKASFAGMYQSYLNLTDLDATLTALQACYRSLWEPHAVQYRAAMGISQSAELMAVVVMEMVPAEVAGVAFSVNPTTGSRDEVLINASWGLGESVVSGRTSPDHIVAGKADGVVRTYNVGPKELEIVANAAGQGGTRELSVDGDRSGAPVLSEDDVRSLVELTRAVEEHYGQPQDIEFAKAQGQWFLLQSRPVTGL